MREILFRAKNFHDKWLYGYYDGSAEDPALIDENDYGSAFWIKGETLGQYTGFKDKNGVKIFEGDIVKCVSPIDEATMVIIFEEGEFRMVLTKRFNNYNTDAGYFAMKCFEKELIGNIYDNPKLLESGENK